MEPIVKNEIRFDLILKLVKENIRKFIIVMFAAAAISSALILCVPRYYVASAMLVPEFSEKGGSLNGALSSAASLLGVNFGGMSGSEAIVPEFYPHIISSNDFLVSLMKVPVTTQDSLFTGTYAEYMLTQQKAPWWGVLMKNVNKVFSAPKPVVDYDKWEIDPFKLTLPEQRLLNTISSLIECSVDEKTGIIYLSAQAQDPLVAATMTNVVRERIQDFVTDYRTGKTRQNLQHFTLMCDSARLDYVYAQKMYADYVDKHQGVSREAHKVEMNRLKNELDQAFSIYNAINQQKIMTEGELLNETPVFTILQNSTVPVKPAGPKRMIFVAVMTILSMLVYLFVIVLRSTNSTNENGQDE